MFSLSILGLATGCPGGKSEVPTNKDDGNVDDGADYTGDLEPLANLSSSGGNCVTNSGGMIDWSGQGVQDYNTVGYNGSRRPDSSSVKTARSSGACPQNTGFVSNTAGAGGIDPKTGDTWFTTLGDLGNCYGTATAPEDGGCGTTDSNSCSGQYDVTIIPTSGHTCNEYDTVRVDLEAKSMFASRRAPPDADCSAGSGRFQLVPVAFQNRDGDSSSTVEMLPFQISGTGVMTNQAWITEIDKVAAPTGKTIRVLKANAAYVIGSSDLLGNASTVSIAITGQHSISSGVVSGNAPFVLEEIADADYSGGEVDMTWSCGSGAASVTRPQGYSFSLEDIGCDDARQKLTLRVPTSPNRVEVEQYGNPNWSYVTPTTTVPAGKAFVIDIGDFYVDGVVLSTGGSNAQVRFDNIQFDGEDICTTGTYTFGLE